MPIRTGDLIGNRYPVTLSYLKTDELPCGLDKWTWRKVKPNTDQLRAIVALFMRELVDYILSNHVYIVNDTIYLQDEGAPIGLEIAQVLGRLSRIYHDSQFRQDLTNPTYQLSQILHSGFEDDITTII